MTSAVSSTIAASVLSLVLAAPSIARADEAGRADVLFREGRTLLDAKKYDEACPKLAESNKLEPGAGTLVALSMCHEGQGKTATAYRELKDAAALGRQKGRNDLANAADKRAAAIEPTLPHLVVRMPEGATGYDVRCDGEKAEARGEPFAVDPGEHRVEVSAKGKSPRSYVVKLAAGATVEIVIEKLDDVAPVAVAAPPPRKEPMRVVPLTEPPAVESDQNRGSAQRIVGGGLIAAGVIGLGAGAYFGGRAISQNAGADGSKDPSAHDPAKKSFQAAVISVGAGTGAITAGAIVYLLAPKSAAKSAIIVPDAGPNHAGVGVLGAF
jgi:hypothetical protein